MDLRDHIFSLLLRKAAPLVMAPPGPLPATGFQLRGVVGYGEDRARVFFSPDAQMNTGIGYEFLLIDGDRQLNVDAAIDWLRMTTVRTGLSQLIPDPSKTYDCHANLVMDARAAGFPDDARSPLLTDHNLFSLLSILIHGGGFPWFEDVYTCVGFMLLTADTCRIYVKITATGMIQGLQIPLKSADGRISCGMGGSFPQELASILRVGNLFRQKILDVRDDYCETVFDMTPWVDPQSQSKVS